MKLDPKWRANTTHTPKRTFKELAEEFGLTPPALVTRMRFSTQSPPKPTLVSRGCFGGARNTWYDPVEMRAWWKREQEAEATA